MSIFKRIKSMMKDKRLSNKPTDFNQDQMVQFSHGNQIVCVNSKDENVISIDIDPEYCGKILGMNLQIGSLYEIRPVFIHDIEKLYEINNQLVELKIKYQLILEEIAIKYFSQELDEIKNPFSIALNTLSGVAFFYNAEKPLVFK